MDTRSLWWWNSTQLSKSWCFFLPLPTYPFSILIAVTLKVREQSITRSGVSSTLSKAIWWPKKTPTLTRTNWRKTPTMAYKQETNSPPAPEITQLLLIHIYTWKKQISPTSHKQIPTTSTLHYTTHQPYTNLVELQILLHVAVRPSNPSSITTT